MNEKILNTRIQLKHDLESNWNAKADFIPKDGEIIIYDIDSTHSSPRIKIGDNQTKLSELPFFSNSDELESLKNQMTNRIDAFSTDFNTFKANVNTTLTSSDTNLDTINEIVTYIKKNRTDIENISSIKLDKNLNTSNANKILITDNTGSVTTSNSVTATELEYLNGVTGKIQNQINSAINLADGKMAKTDLSVITNGTGNAITSISYDNSGNIIATKDASYNYYTLPVAGTTIGGVKSGTGITVDANGNVSINDNSHAHTIANVSNLQNILDNKVSLTGAGASGTWGINISGNASTATALQTARMIFSRPFDGTNNVEGKAQVYGTYLDNPGLKYACSGLEIRESDLVEDTKDDFLYAPSIGFHWGNRIAATLSYHCDSKFYFRSQDGVSRATIDANLDGFAASAPWEGITNKPVLFPQHSQTIVIEGDANTYYPVVVGLPHDKSRPYYISIYKNLDSKTPATYPNNHSQSGSSMWLLYEGRFTGWDGNGGYVKCLHWSMPYADLCAQAHVSTKNAGALIINLRGGGCEYQISTDQNSCYAAIYYEHTNIGSENYPEYVAPLTTLTNCGKFSNAPLGYGNIEGRATALTQSVGSATQPVFFSDGYPVATTFTLNKSVPSDAVFTDTNTWRGIQNVLTSDSTSDSLSAAQGKILKGLIDSHTHNYLPITGNAVSATTATNSNKIYINGSAVYGDVYFSATEPPAAEGRIWLKPIS